MDEVVFLPCIGELDQIDLLADAIAREFASGATPATICARSIRALRRLGVRHVYISNLPVSTAAAAMRTILDLVETEGN